MKNFLKSLLGVNTVSLLVLAHSGFKAFTKATNAAFTVTHIHDSRDLLSIPEVRLEDVLGDKEPTVVLSVMKDEGGRMPLDQAVALLAILVKEQPKEVLEIGTFNGHTTALMAQNLEHSIIHTVDLPEDFSSSNDMVTNIPKDDFHLIEKREVGKEYKNKPYSNRVIQHFGDSAVWDFKEAGHPTFFFIDGSHTYEYCKSDTEKCMELSSGKGVFLWHDCDYGHEGVVRFLAEWRKNGYDVVRIQGTPLAYLKLS
jgi:hypothetical protein